ncbi:hypothetical protein HK104_005127 [Borealophlyctis nickersoniae]|nr:hypothetical protein HK104_005127 [Borealophlyctis nickersoniae]
MVTLLVRAPEGKSFDDIMFITGLEERHVEGWVAGVEERLYVVSVKRSDLGFVMGKVVEADCTVTIHQDDDASKFTVTAVQETPIISQPPSSTLNFKPPATVPSPPAWSAVWAFGDASDDEEDDNNEDSGSAPAFGSSSSTVPASQPSAVPSFGSTSSTGSFNFGQSTSAPAYGFGATGTSTAPSTPAFSGTSTQQPGASVPAFGASSFGARAVQRAVNTPERDLRSALMKQAAKYEQLRAHYKQLQRQLGDLDYIEATWDDYNTALKRGPSSPNFRPQDLLR